MADKDDTNTIAAPAQVEATVAARAPQSGKASGKTSLRRKMMDRGQTSLSSASPIVLPADLPVTTKTQKSDKVAPAVKADSADTVQPGIAKVSPATLDVAPVSQGPVQTEPTPTDPVEIDAPAVSLKRSAGRPRKIASASSAVATTKPASAKRAAASTSAHQMPVKPMPVEPVAAKPTHSKLPSSTAAHSSAPAAKVAAGLAATSRPSLRAPRITKPVSTPQAHQSPAFSIKDLTMDMSANFNGFQDAMGQAQAKAQAAFEKSSSMLGEAGEFAKGNVEAMIESSKILADGMQEFGSSLVAESRTAFEAMTGDIKELAAVKSPTDFLKIQSDMVRKNFDSAVAHGSKNSETFLKLMSDAFAPLSGRVSLAVEKARQIAPVNAPMNSAI